VVESGLIWDQGIVHTFYESDSIKFLPFPSAFKDFLTGRAVYFPNSLMDKGIKGNENND
jgi:hypothetical protein